MAARLNSISISRLLLVGAISYLVIFFIYPLLAIFARSFGIDSAYSFEPFISLLSNPYYLGRIWFTIYQAMISTLLAMLVGLPAAFLFARYEFRGKTLLKSATTLPFVLPTIVVAIGFLSLFGSQGIVNTALMELLGLTKPPIEINNSLTIIFMAHAFYNYSIVVRIVSALWSNLDHTLEETARMLGAGPVTTFCRITLPMLLPAIISSAILAFAFSFTSFGIVLILGGPQFATMEVAIFELTAKLFRLPLAAALSIIQLAFTYLFLLLYAKFQAQSVIPLTLKPHASAGSGKLIVRDRVFITGMIIFLLTILSPLIALLLRAIYFEDGHISGQITNLFSNERGSYFHISPLGIIWNSIRFALLTVVISTTLGVIAAYFISKRRKRSRHISDALFMLPLGVSSITLGFGYIVALSYPPVDIRGSWVILVIAHSLIAYPFVIRSILPVLEGIVPNLREAASLLGADSTKVFILIDVPIIAPAILVGATFAFAVSMGEFGASLLLVRPEFTTMPVAIFRFLGLPGAANLGNALTMSGLLMIVVSLGFIAIERFRYKGVGGF